MKTLIESFYRIEVEQIKNNDHQFCFFSNNNKYIFQEYKGKPCIEVLFETQKYQFFHKIIPTYDGNIFANYNNKKYILLKININNNRKIKLSDLEYLASFSVNVSYINADCRHLWMKKIDNFESYIENKDEMFEFREYYDYFIGMGENAISYSKYVMFDKVSYGFTLDRVSVEYTLYDLYNPLNIVKSFVVRGISDYLRSLFFSNNIIDLDCICNLNINYYDRILLFSRMLFPIQFFDLFKKGTEEDREKIQHVISRSFLYEKYLLEFFLSLKKRHQFMPSIKWLGINQF